ncbi:hypothetical protein EBU94_03880, partial [bacterium]|nr:hypothetical protein [bacterium]
GTNITLSNCVLWGHASSTSSATEYVVQGACDSNLLIENCVIRGAREGIVSAGSNPVAKYGQGIVTKFSSSEELCNGPIAGSASWTFQGINI